MFFWDLYFFWIDHHNQELHSDSESDRKNENDIAYVSKASIKT